MIVGGCFHVTEDNVNQFHCGTLWLVLINGSHGPEMVSPSWLTTRSHASVQHISQPTRSLPLIRGLFRNVGVYVLCRIWGSPQLRPSNMPVNHALLVRWSSGKGCLADFDVTHTEHAYGLHPYEMINKWSKRPSFRSVVDHSPRGPQMWAGILMTQVIQQVANYRCDGPRGSEPTSSKWSLWTSQEKHIRLEPFWFQMQTPVLILYYRKFSEWHWWWWIIGDFSWLSTVL